MTISTITQSNTPYEYTWQHQFSCGPEEDPVVSSVPVVFIFNNGRYEVEYVRFRTPAVLSEARNMAEEAAFWRMNADQTGRFSDVRQIIAAGMHHNFTYRGDAIQKNMHCLTRINRNVAVPYPDVSGEVSVVLCFYDGSFEVVNFALPSVLPSAEARVAAERAICADLLNHPEKAERVEAVACISLNLN
jgi:hypothetical protein